VLDVMMKKTSCFIKIHKNSSWLIYISKSR